MRSFPVSVASTSGRLVKSDIRTSGSEEEGGVDKFLGFPRRLVSYPPRSDAFKEFCKARASIGSRWGRGKARLAALHGEEEMGRMGARLMKEICLGVEEERTELKRKKVELKRNVARLKSNLSKEGKRMEALKASQIVEINKLQAEAKVNLEEVVAERDRLGRHLMSKGYSEDEVDAIRADTYVEEDEDEEAEDVVVSVVEGLDGVSPQTVRGSQGDYNKCPELENKKELKDICLRIKDLKVELAMERETTASLLSSQAELQVKLESTCLREDEARQCNQEFAEEYDRMRRRIKIEKINM
ncbi:hypothetical protein GIB67_000272 [Kingdonia uniflora]|uniref:Uncharacterized protein n=1 Tax=Kingdonia uniflora TaxID=39325 RepID=A0A7J7LCH2_9MAGN|nr:hypothetical protein GIB67_000272 [Kingdonia uniflora]